MNNEQKMRMIDVGAEYDSIGVEGYRQQRERLWQALGWIVDEAMLGLCKRRFAGAEGFRFLDIGCGYGGDMAKVIETLKRPGLNIEVKGIEVSSKMVEETKKAGFDCMQADFMDLSDNEGKWDFIWCNMVLMHFAPSDVYGAIQKMKSLLADEGVIGIGIKTKTALEEDALGQIVVDRAHETIKHDRMQAYFHQNKFRALLEEAGLKMLMQITEPSPRDYDYSWFFVSKKE